MLHLADASGATEAGRLDGRAGILLTGLLLVSFAPWLIFHRGLVDLGGDLSSLAMVSIWLVAHAHVAITGFFWFDSQYRGHIATARGYHYALPVAIVAVSLAAVLATGPTGLLVFILLATGWNQHHFGRQNWGLVCLAASATQGPRAGRAEFWTAETAAASSILLLATGLPIPGLEAWRGPLRDAAALLAYGTTAAGCVLAARLLWTGASPLRAAMPAMAGAFFLPVHIFDPTSGMISVAVAHSVQYCVLMGCLGAARHPSAVRNWLAPMVALGAVYVAILVGHLHLQGSDWAPAVTVLVTGVAIWHYLADADLWKLRHEFQRRAMRARLPYLFP